MTRQLLRAPLAALAVCVFVCAGIASAATYNYTDTTFANADWIGVKLVDTSSPAASFTAAQVNVGGSALLPGPQTPNYRGIGHTYGGGAGGAIVVSHEGVNFDWNPLPFEVATTVDYSYDLNFFTGPSGAVGFAPAIFQSGNVYRTTFDNIFGPASGWQRFSQSGLPLATFQQIDPATGALLAGTPNPLAAMSFGFISANSANGTSTKDSGIDDYRFTLNTVIPEPTTGLALAAMMAAAFSRRRPAR